jgi:hypothetical protein
LAFDKIKPGPSGSGFFFAERLFPAKPAIYPRKKVAFTAS